jgi:hypothetical protein
MLVCQFRHFPDRKPPNTIAILLIILPPLAGGELEGGGFHPHLNPLPSRARNFILSYAVNYNTIAFYKACLKLSSNFTDLASAIIRSKIYVLAGWWFGRGFGE